MKRTIFLLTLLIFVGISTKAQEIPDGATLRYYGERSHERYGLTRQYFTIYEQAGATFLVRRQMFTGAEEIVQDIDGIARNAEKVTMPLTSRQVKTIRKALKKARFPELLQTFLAEQQTYEQYVKAYMAQFEPRLLPPGDTTRQLIQRPKEHVQFHAPSHWRQAISWPGTLEGYESTHTFYTTPTYDDNWTSGHPARDRYLTALDAFHQQLNDMVYAYKMQHPYEGEIQSYRFSTSGGMMMLIVDGKRVRRGTEINLRKKDGQWLVCGYVNEQEDTVQVGPEVIQHVEELVNALDFSALHPQFKDNEEVVKVEVDDGISWSLQISCHTRKTISEWGTFGETYFEPKRAGKAYDAFMKGVESINEYLGGKLHIKRR
ncbi:MAG: hypothetical protein IKT00_13790 [Prevotella sp.]|nr:hypothetical protein [Prevotella sp.]